MAALILDANVLIGLLDTADAHHARAVEHVEAADKARHRLLTPAVAYTEALVAFARVARTEDAVRAIRGMGILVADQTQAIAVRAAELRARHPQLRTPDAIVLATAREHQARLLTYDTGLNKLAEQQDD